MLRAIRIALPLLVLIVVGCTQYAGRSDRNRGWVRTPDGRNLSQTDSNVRLVHELRIQHELRAAVDDGEAAVTAAIEPKPRFQEGDDSEPGSWVYDTVRVTVSVPTAFPLDAAAITAVAEDEIAPKLRWPVRDQAARLQVSILRDDATAAKAAIEQPSQTTVTTTDLNRRYLVQKGDTLADISAAFYGSSQHWRLIKDANPSVTRELEPGTELVIPPLPAD